MHGFKVEGFWVVGFRVCGRWLKMKCTKKDDLQDTCSCMLSNDAENHEQHISVAACFKSPTDPPDMVANDQKRVSNSENETTK